MRRINANRRAYPNNNRRIERMHDPFAGRTHMKRSLIPSMLAACWALSPLAASASCDAPGTWMVRAGVHNISPTQKSDMSGLLSGAVIEVGDKAGPTFNLDYTFCRNFTVDVLASLPYTHDVKITTPGLGNVGTVQHLPPTVTLQYHPLVDGPWDPFVGIGVNYTMFFNQSLNIPGLGLDLKNTVGPAAQVGVDYKLPGTPWRVGADVRYIQIEPKAYINGNDVGKVKIDPLAYGMTVGYSF
jgi:outer membrane protein